MRTVLLGATKGMGRELARLMAERGDPLCLLGRDTADLQRSAHDLVLRGAPEPVGTVRCDLAEASSFAPALEQAERLLGRIECVVLTAALFDTQGRLEEDLEATHRMLAVNFADSIAFCEQARRRLLAAGGGTLCAFSSVAGERPRKSVVLYGAAKAGLTHYLESLDLRFRSAGLKVVCVKPGFVRTGMTAGLPAPPFAGEPDVVARRVLRAIDRGDAVVFAPPIWRWMMLVLRLLPRSVMRRVEF